MSTVVTGSASGIGAATCARLAARGQRVIGVDVRDALNPANLEFVETHRKEMDELGRSQYELEKVSKEALGE